MSLIVMCALRQPSQVSSWVSMEKNECGLGELGLNAVVHGLEGHTVDFNSIQNAAGSDGMFVSM